ncbi:unnamed protein product, partial [Rotaria sordida]
MSGCYAGVHVLRGRYMPKEDRSFPCVTLESNRGDELFNLNSRLLDIRNEHQRMLLP